VDGNKYIYISDFESIKDYKQEVEYWKNNGYIVKKVEGGVICFQFIHDYEVWKRQKQEEKKQQKEKEKRRKNDHNPDRGTPEAGPQD
jgi:hypothetical protein